MEIGAHFEMRNFWLEIIRVGRNFRRRRTIIDDESRRFGEPFTRSR